VEKTGLAICTTIGAAVKPTTDSRVFLLVLDGFGIGAAPDAGDFGDQEADTLGHIAEFCHQGKAENSVNRKGPLHIPFLESLGLGYAAELSSGKQPAGFTNVRVLGRYAACREISLGKDTSSGHWEIAGRPVLFNWGYFPEEPSFPEPFIESLIKQAGLPGILGNCHASGTEIIKKLGDEHIRSGKPICYTSVDSVFQVAAHEDHFGLERLYNSCRIAREILDSEGLNIARVIARPFTGYSGKFTRTHNRKDYSVPPPGPTLLDSLLENNRMVYAIGKISEIFSGRGISKSIKPTGNNGIYKEVLDAATAAEPGSLVFANFVDFDMLYGHRRDITGYAAALEILDGQLEELSRAMKDEDLLVITADHGCDPAGRGFNHTREFIPVLLFGSMVRPGCSGIRPTFADIGQTVTTHLEIPPLKFGSAIDLAGW
jgi:phosphopentomutase